MFVVARSTGLRAGEARTLRKSQIDFKTREITVHSSKGMSARRKGRTRKVAFEGAAFEVLKRRAATVDGDWIFPNRTGNGPLSDHLVAFKSACARAKVPYGLGKEGGVIFNDARRTRENEMLDAGHSVRAVGDMLGHSPETMARHYHRSTPEQRKQAAETPADFDAQNLGAQTLVPRNFGKILTRPASGMSKNVGDIAGKKAATTALSRKVKAGK